MDITILYYTSNREDENFENRVRQNILKHKGNLPIVSVSQKPIDLGKNICVGKHTPCYQNLFRQIRIGLAEIDTDYVLATEADFLYPPAYFTFIPKKKNKCYRYWGVWICYYKNKSDLRPKYHFKGYSNGAQLVDRKLWIKKINKFLTDKEYWATTKEPVRGLTKVSMKTDEKYTWTSDIPAVSFKTINNINPSTQVSKELLPKWKLPYWGRAKDLRRRMFEEK